jgi:deoxyribose-phosphate aldolase
MPTDLAALIDHTLLRPDATAADVRRLCAEARRHGFAAVCVNPGRVALAAAELAQGGVAVCSVVGFPLGATTTDQKCAEAAGCLDAGASEIDMVLNLGLLADGDEAGVEADIRALADLCRARGALLKVILETCLLDDDAKRRACRLAVRAGAHFVKTSTGFAGGGATVEDIALMSAAVKESGLGVKASGGIRDRAQAEAMVAAGATRLGTSASVDIVTEI